MGRCHWPTSYRNPTKAASQAVLGLCAWLICTSPDVTQIYKDIKQQRQCWACEIYQHPKSQYGTQSDNRCDKDSDMLTSV